MAAFSFTWNKTKPAGSKVFSRKRKPKLVTEQNTINKINKNSSDVVDSKQMSETRTVFKKSRAVFQKKKVRLHSTIEEKTIDVPHKFIKRKHKKNKIAVVSSNIEDEKDSLQTQESSKTVQNKRHSLFSEKYKTVFVRTGARGKSIVEKVFSDGKKFTDLSIHKYLKANLEKSGYETLTNVQEKSIPTVLSGQNILIRSQTGSGKTLVYAIPILNALLTINPKLQRNDGVQAIVVVPTRELTLQTHEIFSKLNSFQWIVIGHLCGGENRKTEKDRLRKGVHILIGTPGRLLDHILHTTAFKINNVRCLVLDEADRLLDMGFKRDIVRLVEALDSSEVYAEYNPLAILKSKMTGSEEDSANESLKSSVSKLRQTILLSATLSKGIAELANFTMKEHVYIDALDESETVNPEHMIIPSTVKQGFILTYVKHRLFTLSALLVEKSRKPCKVIVFMATSQMVDYHYELFTRYLLRMPKSRGKIKDSDIVLLEMEDSDDEEEVVLDIDFFKLHGNMDQSKRKEVFSEFRTAKKGVLICTDVAARGLDVPDASCIIQYTGPQSDDDYLHRVGRTGRAGKIGSAIICLTHEEQEYITRLQEHKVFLQEYKPADFLKYLCDIMEEPSGEEAGVALQKHYENALKKDSDLHKMACFAYSSWSRFYNTYPLKLQPIFDFRKLNLGHYVTSFGLQETPTAVARIVRQKVATVDSRRLNKKLAIHQEEQPKKTPQKRKIKSVSLTTSEFSSGLKPKKKKIKIQH